MVAILKLGQLSDPVPGRPQTDAAQVLHWRRYPRLVPQPGQNTSSHGVPAISAARPQHVTAGGQLLVPALDDALCLSARGSIGPAWHL